MRKMSLHPGTREPTSAMEEKPSNLPVMWKALPPKYSGEVYFVGKQEKKNQRKFRGKPPDLMVNQQEQKRGELGCWGINKVKDIFPQMKDQCKNEDADIDEIKVLSLEDLKIHTKRVTKEKPVEEELWSAADFPSVEIGSRAANGGIKMKAEHGVPSDGRSFSLLYKKLEFRESFSGCETHCCKKVFTSNYCQTDPLLFAENYTDVNVKYLTTNLPPDLNKLFLDYLFERDELRRLLVHLLKLLCDSEGKSPQVSSVPLKTALSSSEKALLLSQIF